MHAHGQEKTSRSWFGGCSTLIIYCWYVNVAGGCPQILTDVVPPKGLMYSTSIDHTNSHPFGTGFGSCATVAIYRLQAVVSSTTRYFVHIIWWGLYGAKATCKRFLAGVKSSFARVIPATTRSTPSVPSFNRHYEEDQPGLRTLYDTTAAVPVK